MIANIISVIASIAIFTWSIIKKTLGIVVGYDDGIKGQDEEAKKREMLKKMNELKKQRQENESNDWNKHPIYKDTIRYREGKHFRFIDNNNTYYYSILAIIITVISVLIYILTNNLLRVMRLSDLNIFRPLYVLLANKIVMIILTIITLIILITIGVVIAVGVPSKVIVNKCDAKTEKIVVESSEMELPKDSISWSYNMWLYIKDWEYNNGVKKIFFSKKDSIKISMGEDNPEIELLIYTKKGKEKLVVNKTCNYNNICKNGIDIGKWNMLTITINNNNVRVYHNGSLIVGKILQDIPSINENNLIVGKVDKKGSFDGKIHNVKYFNKQLEQNDINKLYFKKPN